jgi:hypothetical protein
MSGDLFDKFASDTKTMFLQMGNEDKKVVELMGFGRIMA